MPIIFAWVVGGVFAAGAAWVVGKISLGLRSDYLAIATLGISEIIVAILKNEDWLARGVKNVTGLSRPVPYEVDLQQSAKWFQDWVGNAWRRHRSKCLVDFRQALLRRALCRSFCSSSCGCRNAHSIRPGAG